MPLYLTTSKAAGDSAISLCSSLALLIPGAVFERRGSKSIESVVERARILGKTRVLVSSEKELHFMRVTATSWEWMEPVLKIEKAEFAELLEGLPAELMLEGENAKIWKKFLGETGESDEEEEEFVVLKCLKDSVSFNYEKKKIGELVFSHGSSV